MTEMTGAQEEEIARSSVVAPEFWLPRRLDMRRAFDIYVFGRSRTLGPGEKGSAVGGAVAVPFAEPSGEDAVSTPAQRGQAVPVPDELRFDRGAGTWRHRAVSSKE